MIEIEVPATSANLGPGFDCLGMALSLSNRIRVEIAEENRVRGCPPEWAGDDNLFLRSFRHTCGLVGAPVPQLEVELVTDIPPARGLGSSASLTVGGAAAALLLTQAPGARGALPDERSSSALTSILHAPAAARVLLRAATDIEGHPDNAAPAIAGGFTAAAADGPDIVVSRANLPPSWRYVACIPDFDLETSVARRALPDSYARGDVVHALSHATLMALAFQTADPSLLRRACEDRVHEPYRRRLIPDFDTVAAACHAQGCDAVWISGSGPTILAAFAAAGSMSGSTPSGSSGTDSATDQPTAFDARIHALSAEIAANAAHHWRVLPLIGDNRGVRARHLPRGAR